MAEQDKIIDIEFGLAQLSGNRTLLITLLGKLQQEYKDLPSKLHGFQQQNDNLAIKHAVHTVKGVSGNLGLVALHESAKTLETAVIGDGPFQQELDKFNSVLAKSLNQIDKLTTDGQTTESATEASAEPEQDSALVELKGMVQRNEFITPDKLAHMLQQTELSQSKQQQLSDAINDLDYPQALVILNTND